MKRFEDYYWKCAREEWMVHYVDYNVLKEKLCSFSKRRKAVLQLIRPDGYLPVLDFQELLPVARVVEDSSYFQYTDEISKQALVDAEDALFRLSVTERNEFSAILESELSKASRFYCETVLVHLRMMLLKKDDEIETKTLAMELLEATAFCVSNIVAFRQALIRYDGFRRTFDGMSLTEWHLQRSLNDDDETSHNLLILDKDLEALILQKLREEKSVTTTDLEAELEHLESILEKTGGTLSRAVDGHIVFQDRILVVIRQSLLFGLQSYGLQLEHNLLRMRGRHLKAEVRAVAAWRETRNDTKKDTFKSRLQEMEPSNVLPLLLNLMSCFLFMCNNYIIEPSSAYYANALGSSDALSGIMIGAAPWFALISAIGYSYWTNYNYKTPIVFAGTLMMVGNLIYSNAYSYQSMEMCLLGRAITGLGAPRIINRRYVADATPFSLRTIASASFAMATALGAALGPGMAIILDMFEFEFYIPLLGKQYFNGMTGPGYFMALCWFIYTLAILLTFKEPVRSGLDELKEREGEEQEQVQEPADALLTQGKSCGEWDDDNSDDNSTKSVPTRSTRTLCCGGCFQHITKPVAICMSLIFMKRIALESIVGSTSVITKNRFAWTIKNVGTLHLCNGLIVIPVSVLSGWLSTKYEDRYLALWFLAITLAGMTMLVDLTDMVSNDNETYNEGRWLAVGPGKYIAGSLVAFSGIEACESYVASLMSKVVPSALAVGTFNSGLLATLVGTGGRATGDLFITLMGLISIRNLLNLLIVPGAALVAFSLFVIRYNYGILGV
jgi:hypothetical protein